MFDDRADAFDVTVVATFDNLCVKSCFFAAANEANESSLFGVVLIGVEDDGVCDDGDNSVDVDDFGRPEINLRQCQLR
jgi:hypothetical protein